MNLSIEEKILLYLYLHRDDFNGLQGTENITQDGLSRAIGFKRTHATRILEPMVQKGVIEKHRAHVPGRKRKVYVYVPTMNGLRTAENIMRRNSITRIDLERMFSPVTTKRMSPKELASEFDLDPPLAEMLYSLTKGDPDIARKVVDMSKEVDGDTMADRITLAFLKIKGESNEH